MGIVLTTNNAWGILSTAVATTDTTLTLQSGQGARFPAIVVGSGNWFYASIIDSSNNIERCLVTATSGDQFTITRGVDGSSPLAFAAGARVENRWTSAAVVDIQTQINTVQTNLTNAVTALVAELNAAIPVGMIMLWHGSVASIPAGWALCNGSNGTIDLRDRFVVGAGNAYAPAATGGAGTVTLAAANMPSHNHSINDPGHAHSVYDPGHGHGVSDPGHAHGVSDPGHVHNPAVMLPSNLWNGGNAYIGNGTNNFSGGGGSNLGIGGAGFPTASSGSNIGIYGSGTGIGIAASGSNIGIYAAATGISTQAAGGGAAFGILPPYYAVCYIMRTGSFS